MAADLATAMAISAGLCAGNQKFNVGDCAKCSAGRIGEAQNPGPVPTRRQPRDVKELEGVALVEPVTQALQSRVWDSFERWLRGLLSAEAIAQLTLSPLLFMEVLRSYGFFLYGHGHRLYEFRHFLVMVQQRYPWIKQYMFPAWSLVTKWQSLQPIEHRRPLHAVLFQALVALGVMRGWHRWAATVALGFHGIARISEVLRASRGDLVLPSIQ